MTSIISLSEGGVPVVDAQLHYTPSSKFDVHWAPNPCFYSFQFHVFIEGTCLVRAEPLEVSGWGASIHLYTCKFLFLYVFLYLQHEPTHSVCMTPPKPDLRVCVFQFRLNIRVGSRSMSSEDIYTDRFWEDLWNISKTGAVKSSVVGGFGFFCFFFWDATHFQTHARTHSSSIKPPLLPLQFIARRHSNFESELIMLLPSLNFGALSLWMETEWTHSTCISTRNGYASDSSVRKV